MEIDCTFFRGNESIPKIGDIVMVAGFYHVIAAILAVRWKDDGHIIVKVDARPVDEAVDRILKDEPQNVCRDRAKVLAP